MQDLFTNPSWVDDGGVGMLRIGLYLLVNIAIAACSGPWKEYQQPVEAPFPKFEDTLPVPSRSAIDLKCTSDKAANIINDEGKGILLVDSTGYEGLSHLIALGINTDEATMLGESDKGKISKIYGLENSIQIYGQIDSTRFLAVWTYVPWRGKHFMFVHKVVSEDWGPLNLNFAYVCERYGG